MQVLEEVGVFQNIKRFAGASVGSIVSLFAALGYDSYVLENVISQNLQTLMYGKLNRFLYTCDQCV